jgi:hypothetical protein
MNRLAIVSVIALPIAAATAALPAGASTGVHFRVVGVHSLVRPDQPNTNITGLAAAGKFVPAKLTVAEYTESTCVPNGTDVSFTMTNTSSKTAYIYYGGAVVIKLKASAVEDICFYGGAAGETAKFNLSNKSGSTVYKGKLKVTLSD